jgi:hypothetical protein
VLGQLKNTCVGNDQEYNKEDCINQQKIVLAAYNRGDTQKCEEEILRLTKMMSHIDDDFFVRVLYDTCVYLNNYSAVNPKDHNISVKIAELVQKYLNVILEKKPNGTNALECQLLASFLKNENTDEKIFVKSRKEKASQLVNIWSKIESKTEKEWNLMDHTKEFEPFNSPYMYMPRMRPEDIPDKNERSRYKEYLAKQSEIIRKHQEMENAVKIQKRNKDLFISQLITMYSKSPSAKKELQNILTQYIKDNNLIQQIINTVH